MARIRSTQISSSFAVLYPYLTGLLRYRFAVAWGCRLTPSMVYFCALAFDWAKRRIRYAKVTYTRPSYPANTAPKPSLNPCSPRPLKLMPLFYHCGQLPLLRTLLESLVLLLFEGFSYLAGRTHDSMSRSICARLV